MCRISGIINKNLPIEQLHSMVREMCTIMKHGGPDDEGIYCDPENNLVLGHRRLSLIDLTVNGHQPMSYDNGRYLISFNGEIYNYKELKSELVHLGKVFKTGSDTEVILAAFSQWGTASFEKLNGMFAFALWDQITGNIYLVRDSAGVKPLYYAITREGLAFASEVKAFKSIPYLQEENESWRVYMMAYGFLPEPVTTLKNVQPVPKGSYICYDVHTGSADIKNYQKYQFTEELTDREEVIHLIQKTLQNSVKRNLVSDAPIGVFLSGGIDSSIIALLASKNIQKLNTVSIYFNNPEFSEKKYQDILQEKISGNYHQFLLTESEFHQNLPNVLEDMDLPSSDGLNTWFISKFARHNGLKAVLSGIGADELYGGYPSFQRVQKMLFLEKLPTQLLQTGKYPRLRKLRRIPYLSLGGTVGKYLFLRGQFIPSEIADHLDIDESIIWKMLQETPEYAAIHNLTPGNQASWLETNIYMQNQLLRDADVMSMAHGLEIRVPFLDKEFTALSTRIGSAIKYAGPRPKQLLIDSFRELLPEPIWNRSKMGFTFPFKEWFSSNEFVRDRVAQSSFDSFLAGKMHWSQLFTLSLIQLHAVAA